MSSSGLSSTFFSAASFSAICWTSRFTSSWPGPAERIGANSLLQPGGQPLDDRLRHRRRRAIGRPFASGRPTPPMNSRSSRGPSAASNSRIAGAPVRASPGRSAAAAFMVAGSSSARRCDSSAIGSISPRFCSAASTTAGLPLGVGVSELAPRPYSLGRSVTTLSTMSSGEGSVGVSARPALPTIISTSGNRRKAHRGP